MSDEMMSHFLGLEPLKKLTAFHKTQAGTTF